jgi:hypothetical protein
LNQEKKPVRRRKRKDFPKIQLGYMEIEVQLSDQIRDGGKLGLWDAHRGIITISTSLEGYEFINTLIHEIFHAMYYIGYIRDDGEGGVSEERTVSVLSNLQTELMRRNPWLIEWMMEQMDG